MEKLPRKTRELVIPYFEEGGDSEIIDFYLSLKRDLRFLEKFHPEKIDLKLHDISFEANEEDYDKFFSDFCQREYDHFLGWMDDNGIEEKDWWRAGSSFIPLREDYYRMNRYSGEFELDVDSYTCGCNNMEFLEEVIEDWVTNENIQGFLKDMEKIYFEKKLFTDPGLEEKKEKIEEFLEKQGIDSIRDQLKDQVIDYCNVIRYVRWFKKHQMEIWNEYLENVEEN